MDTVTHNEYLPGTSIARLIVASAAWLINGALALLVILLYRQVVLRVGPAFQVDPLWLGAITKVGMVAVTGIWLVWVLETEHSLRAAATTGWRSLAVTIALTITATVAGNLVLALPIRLLA